jgi:hypothetical protein
MIIPQTPNYGKREQDDADDNKNKYQESREDKE